jgi:hypothetical protein
VHLRIGKEEFVPQLCESRLVEVELPLQQPVGHPLAAAQQLDDLIEYPV